MTDSKIVSGDTLRIAVSKSLKNARNLLESGKLLLKAGKHPTAFGLIALADEEIAKAYMIAYSKGDPEEIKKILDHKEKDEFISKGVKFYTQFELWKITGAEPPKIPASYFKYLNNLKNKAFYVGIEPNTERIQDPEDISIETVRTLVTEVEGQMKSAEDFLTNWTPST